MTRTVPERSNRKQARKALLRVCTVNPQRDEVYIVRGNTIVDLERLNAEEAYNTLRTIGELERCERLWIMRGLTGLGSFQFRCYGHCELQMVKGRAKVTAGHEGKEYVCHKPRWEQLKRAGRVRFVGFLCHYRKNTTL